MTTPTSRSLLAAAQDGHLAARIIALGRLHGHTEQSIRDSLPVIVGAAADAEGATIASVFEYAVATYVPTPAPGENPAAVTDAHILHALEQTFNPEQE